MLIQYVLYDVQCYPVNKYYLSPKAKIMIFLVRFFTYVDIMHINMIWKGLMWLQVGATLP